MHDGTPARPICAELNLCKRWYLPRAYRSAVDGSPPIIVPLIVLQFFVRGAAWFVLSHIPKFGLVLVLVVVLRPRCAGVFCSEKSPIVAQLFCSVILLVKHPDFRGRGRRRARGRRSPISEFSFIGCGFVRSQTALTAFLGLRQSGHHGGDHAGDACRDLESARRQLQSRNGSRLREKSRRKRV